MSAKSLRRAVYGVSLGMTLDNFLRLFPESYELDGAQRAVFKLQDEDRVFNSNHRVEDNGLLFGIFSTGKLVRIGVGYFTRKGPIRARQLRKKYGNPDQKNSLLDRLVLKVYEVGWEDNETQLSVAVRQSGFTLQLADKLFGTGKRDTAGPDSLRYFIGYS